MADLINEQLEEFKANFSFSIKEIFKVSEYRNTKKMSQKHSDTAGVPQINNLRKFVSTQTEKR